MASVIHLVKTFWLSIDYSRLRPVDDMVLLGCVRSIRASSLTEHNKSALTDHATQENHDTMSSTGLKRRWMVIHREPEHFTRWIKEAIHIRKEGEQAMNRDEVSYQLSHAYDRILDTVSSRRVKNRKNWVPASSDEGLW